MRISISSLSLNRDQLDRTTGHSNISKKIGCYSKSIAVIGHQKIQYGLKLDLFGTDVRLSGTIIAEIYIYKG